MPDPHLFGYVDEPGDDASVWRRAEVSADEQQALRELLLHPGWKALQKIWSHQRRALATNVQRTAEDHRFHQGKYHGFREAEAIALRHAEVKEEVAHYSPPSETNLYPRARKTGY